MGSYREVSGDLIRLAQNGEFDVISHGANCQNVMGAGIAPQMAKAFNAHMFPLEAEVYKGDMNKLGQIDCGTTYVRDGAVTRALPFEAYGNHVLLDATQHELTVVNSYTQFGFGRNHKGGTPQPLDYEALTLCMRKINNKFKGKRVGLPLIGCGLGGGDENTVIEMIKDLLVDCDVTLVRYDNSTQ